ncbi:hypothetical protein HMPREF0889_0910 [Megasphaera lornae]|nr:hypothetical protein HMPREF0889_0910 [Megasphaera genomosp. type_1 str. 28L]
MKGGSFFAGQEAVTILKYFANSVTIRTKPDLIIGAAKL